jgi:hypothetical protein
MTAIYTPAPRAFIGLPFVYDDGGRKAAGYTGAAGDCTTRAIAIATGKPYQEVYDELAALGAKERMSKHRRRRGKSHPRTGVWKPTIKRYLESLGWTFTPTMGIGSGCKVHLAPGELPDGRIIAVVSRHSVAVIDGVMHDTYDPSRDGTRCVYGYWSGPYTVRGGLKIPSTSPRSLSIAIALANSDTSYT